MQYQKIKKLVLVEKMEIIKIGKLNPNVLDELKEIQPYEHIMYVANNNRNNFACLKRLNYLLEFIEKNNQSIIQKYIKNLETEFLNLTAKNSLVENNSILSKIFEEIEYLKKYPKLVRNILNFSLQLLKINSEINWFHKIKVKQSDYMRSYLMPNYYFLFTLIKTIGREDSFRFFKKYISQFLTDNKAKIETNFTTLEDRFEKIKESANSSSDWIMIYGMISEGKMFFRNENCLWIDVLKDLLDNEIKYHICCYGDYQTARTYRNEHITLTMEHTIAQGDHYCSRVLHDTRVDWNLKHPSKEFWDNIKI